MYLQINGLDKIVVYLLIIITMNYKCKQLNSMTILNEQHHNMNGYI